MKKIFALIAVAAISIVGAFAFDLSTVKGTWQDARWDANWTFNADGTIVLTIASTGRTVFTFTDENVQNFRVRMEGEGLAVMFDCAATHRSYKFVKPPVLGTDLEVTIDPDWTKLDYRTKFHFVE